MQLGQQEQGKKPRASESGAAKNAPLLPSGEAHFQQLRRPTRRSSSAEFQLFFLLSLQIWRVVCWAACPRAACSSAYRSSPATTAKSTRPYKAASTCCRGRSSCALWTTLIESMLRLLTAQLDTGHYSSSCFHSHSVAPITPPPLPIPRPCRPLFMYQSEFDFSLAAVCTHHLIIAAFHRDKRSV